MVPCSIFAASYCRKAKSWIGSLYTRWHGASSRLLKTQKPQNGHAPATCRLVRTSLEERSYLTGRTSAKRVRSYPRAVSTTKPVASPLPAGSPSKGNAWQYFMITVFLKAASCTPRHDDVRAKELQTRRLIASILRKCFAVSVVTERNVNW